MKIAITADNHLTTLAKNPERFQALGNIYQQCGEQGIQLLIIAGDLFDQSLANYADFEELYQQSRPKDLTTIIIPGNHDETLCQGALAGDGVMVVSEPELKPLNDSRLILFLPFQDHHSMGEGIAPFAESLKGKRWILIGHGDWFGGHKAPDPYESGVYMPLTQPDLKRYQPELAFLGHIHLPQNDGKVYYPGSPCPLNITETGLRRFLILDTKQGEVSSHLVSSPLVNFDEQFLVIPGPNELPSLKSAFQNRIDGWELPPGWEDRVQVRVRIIGSSATSREEIRSAAAEIFAHFRFYQDQPPAMDDLVFSLDEDRAEITAQLQDWVDNLAWEPNPHQPDKTQILQEAIKIIYQVKS